MPFNYKDLSEIMGYGLTPRYIIGNMEMSVGRVILRVVQGGARSKGPRISQPVSAKMRGLEHDPVTPKR